MSISIQIYVAWHETCFFVLNRSNLTYDMSLDMDLSYKMISINTMKHKLKLSESMPSYLISRIQNRKGECFKKTTT